MSTQNEGSNNPGEGQDPNENLTVEQLREQLKAEKASKDRILEESKKYKTEFQKLKGVQDEADKARQKDDEEKLKKQGQYQTLLDQRDGKIKELEDRLNKADETVKGRDKAIANFKKAAAFERALNGKIRQESYWAHVDFDKIAVNPQTGEIDAQSLKKAADDFIGKHKELIDFGAGGNLPNNTPGGSGRLTREQWKKLPLKERKARMKDVML